MMTWLAGIALMVVLAWGLLAVGDLIRGYFADRAIRRMNREEAERRYGREVL